MKINSFKIMHLYELMAELPTPIKMLAMLKPVKKK